ncbi:MAG: hypothetical protein U9Q77_09535 [Candidatus Marinimicrobia bacterium]|nr:hypothetical protein [Candidatus Neomarinimicrobiota bacterium]
MNNAMSMLEIARLIKEYDVELRKELMTSRSGLFRKTSGELYIRSNVPLGQGYSEEVLGIFADPADLDFFYKIYLKDDA